jgi:hypothetical protein
MEYAAMMAHHDHDPEKAPLQHFFSEAGWVIFFGSLFYLTMGLPLIFSGVMAPLGLAVMAAGLLAFLFALFLPMLLFPFLVLLFLSLFWTIKHPMGIVFYVVYLVFLLVGGYFVSWQRKKTLQQD